jgi:hypothetical protein
VKFSFALEKKTLGKTYHKGLNACTFVGLSIEILRPHEMEEEAGPLGDTVGAELLEWVSDI